MSKRWMILLLAGLVTLAGMAAAQQPAGPDEPPLRLKKKKREDKPAKPDDKKKDDKKKDDKKKEEKKTDKEEPGDDEPAAPQEDEKEVLQRVVKNVRDVEDRLAKNDLGEGTRQTQRDILNDIESLIRLNGSPPPEGGGGEGMQNDQEQNGQQSDNKNGQRGKSGGSQKGKGRRTKTVKVPRKGGQAQQKNAKGNGKNGSKPGNKSGTSQAKAGGGNGEAGQGGDKPGGKNGQGGNGGAGGDRANRPINRTGDLYKDEWGHLPPSLRAQMDAYSNPQPFLPKYDDLIKRYYRTIAEQGRRKGD